MEFKDLEKINEGLKTCDIKGKAYVQVNTRVLAFRQLFPNGTIETNMESDNNGVCVFSAKVKDEEGKILATGHAYEKESSSYINKTSYIENCETSAVGRALAFLGIGIDGSMCSAEELANAVMNQGKEENTKDEKIDSVKVKALEKILSDVDNMDARVLLEETMLRTYKAKELKDITLDSFRKIINGWEKSVAWALEKVKKG